jgi:hypothetical protein
VILGLNVCTKEEEAKCKIEIEDESYFKWACEKCDKKKIKEIHPWTEHLMTLRRLIKAGYPINKNDLSFFEWRDLGILNEMLDSSKRIL